MGTRLVNPDSLPRPVGYAHAVVGSGRPVVLAGQVGCDRTGKVVERDDLVAQFDRALGNVLRALAAAGGKPTDLARLRIYTTDVPGYRARLADLGERYRAHMGRHYPAMALIGVAALFDDGARIEIEGLAYVD